MLRLFNVAGAIIALGAASLFAAMPASAQVVDAYSPDEVAAIMEDFGVDVEIEYPDDAEGPVILAIYEGLQFITTFQACDEDGEACELIVFRRGFAMDPADQPDLDMLNTWNYENWGKAAMDSDGDPWIILEINTVGGITDTNLTDTLKWYVNMVNEFAEYVGFDL